MVPHTPFGMSKLVTTFWVTITLCQWPSAEFAVILVFVALNPGSSAVDAARLSIRVDDRPLMVLAALHSKIMRRASLARFNKAVSFHN